ncbi:hypothetical protein [Sulfitobacter pontiacus]|uniref:hypothetical protein n=1 Tax=Sulfitobacter pontiacus TaxID=60137 RepID=UPI0030EBB092
MQIWWQTGMPLRLGVTDDPEFCAGDGLACDAALFDGVIWLHERMFALPGWEAGADWFLKHEILHAKIAMARMATWSWLGNRRLKILDHAGRDALRLVHSTPSLKDLSVLLTAYRKAGLDEVEEALVRYVQMMDAGEGIPVTGSLLKARRIIKTSWGWYTPNLFRIALWLPVCGWTVRH